MGVDARIMLPGNVRVRDVTKVIGIAAGLPKHWENSGDTRWVSVRGAKVSSYQHPGLESCACINLDGPMVDGSHEHSVMFHFEPNGSEGRLLMPRSTAFWIGIGRRLVDFFGGSLDYDDCDDIDIDYGVSDKSNSLNKPTLNPEWDAFQHRLWNLPPLTSEDLDSLQEYAAYPRQHGVRTVAPAAAQPQE